ncbi:hypothetical protein [Aquimarina agarivorans]|nr:hypothetical protein [Aquimarina agarivorans]
MKNNPKSSWKIGVLLVSILLAIVAQIFVQKNQEKFSSKITVTSVSYNL